ncbi:MAG TPA: hypothetical protein VKK31_00410 [Thermoanaerobaculia bacterium]|nr:hypothetical protein [Thermoanaerobaculia bacterium]
MIRRLCKYGIGIALAFAFVTAASAQGAEQLQMESVHDLAKQMFGLPVVYRNPATPCPDPCPCAQKCSCGTNCTCGDLTDGSPNQKLLGRAWYYGWAVRNLPANSQTRACARQYLLDLLTAQQTYGHYAANANTDEALTISHGQLWIAGMGAAYLFALVNGPTYGGGTSPDTTVLNAVRQWWADEKYLWDQIANGSGLIRAPGARFPAWPNPGEWEYREKVYALLSGTVPSGISAWPTDKYYTGGWIINELRLRGQSPSLIVTPPAGYTVGAKLHDTLCLYRLGGDFLYYFPRLRHASNRLFWVLKQGSNYTFAPLACNPVVNGEPPACAKPANFPGATTVTINGLATAGATPGCPAPEALQ